MEARVDELQDALSRIDLEAAFSSLTATLNQDRADHSPDPDDSAQCPEARNAPPFGSMVRHLAWNSARTVTFLSVRRWRASTKFVDLELLKAAKKECRPDVTAEIAVEIAGAVGRMLKNVSGWLITAPPRGASGKARAHFASEIATNMAPLLGCSYVQAFEDRIQSRSSSPRTWNTRGDMVLTTSAVSGNWLLIDDVATSGTTLEEASRLLGALGPVVPITWIYQEIVKG